MTAPAELQGAWRRTGLLVDGAPVNDFCDVLWIQTASWYVDVRTLRPGSPALRTPAERRFNVTYFFGGRGRWLPPYFVWEHLIDSRGRHDTDRGILRFRGEDVVEEFGTFTADNERHTFQETWTSAGRDGVSALIETDLVDVSAGGHRLALERSDGVWRTGNRAQRTDPGPEIAGAQVERSS